MATPTMEPHISTAPNTPDDPTSLLPKKLARSRPLFDPEIVGRATKASFGKLNPITLLKNPVMFVVVSAGAALTTVFLVRGPFYRRAGDRILNSDLAVALVYGTLRQLRRGHGGSAREGAGG